MHFFGRHEFLIVFFIIMFAKAAVLPIVPVSTISGIHEIRITPNYGQLPKSVQTAILITGGYLFFTKNAMQYIFLDYKKLHAITHEHGADLQLHHTWVRVTWQGASENASWHYEHSFPDQENFILGNNPSRWVRNVISYKKAILKNIYPNVDVQYYTESNTLKYDILVRPKAAIKQIQLRYEGVQSLSLINGNLIWKTNNGMVTEMAPVAYQNIRGVIHQVPCRYELTNNNMVRFKLGNYDENYALIIDPKIVFSSYSGSVADNFGYTATYDQDGNTYIGGVVFNYNSIINCFPFDCNSLLGMPINGFPVSPGAYQQTFRGGSTDIVIFKFSKDGTRRLYATYLGGSEAELPQSMVVNSNNQLILFGSTSSTDFPTTLGAYSNTGLGTAFNVYTNSISFNNGSQVFLSILNESGTDLVASAKVQTRGNSGINYTSTTTSAAIVNPPYFNFGDEARGEVITDKKNNIIVATYTESTQIPGESLPVAKAPGDKTDAWIFKMDSSLRQILFSIRVGGSGNDVAYGLQPDSKGNLFFTGYTLSPDLTGTLSGLYTLPRGGLDAYVGKIDSTGRLLALTYLGTPANDQAFFVQTDLRDDVYIMGQTWSSNFPISGTGTNFYKDEGSGQFIMKLNNSLTGLIFSTVFGSGETGPDISPTAFLVDNCGLIYVSGWRGFLRDVSIKIAGRPLRTTVDNLYNPASATGFYFAVFEKGMLGLFGGYYFGNEGSDHVDGGTSRFDKRGYIHQAICGGCLGTNHTPSTPGVWSETNGNRVNCNMVGVKFDFETVDIRANFVSEPPAKNDTIKVKYGQSINFTFLGETVPGANVSWYNYKYPSTNRNDLRFITEESRWTANPGFPLPTFISLRKWLVEVDYFKSDDCVQRDNQSFFVVVEPSIVGANICNGDSGRFEILGRVKSVLWSPSEGLSKNNVTNPKVLVDKDTTYKVKILSNDNSYSSTYTAPVRVVNYDVLPDFSFSTDSVGAAPHTIFTINNTQNMGSNNQFLWRMGDGNTLLGANIGYTYQKTGRYLLQMKVLGNNRGCEVNDSVSKYVYVIPTINTPTYCADRPWVVYTVIGGTFCVWDQKAGRHSLETLAPCIASVTLVGINPISVVVYSELNKPYSYVFTLAGTFNPFPVTEFDFDTLVERDLQNIGVSFFPKTKVKTLTWNINGVQIRRDSVINHLFFESGLYPVEIFGIDTNGCRYSKQARLDLKLMNIPNVLTPNNDGINDKFEIWGAQPNKTTLKIFNRWGTLVYESGRNNYSNDWNANHVPDGVYFYQLDLDHSKPRTYRGWLQVIR